MATKKKVAKKVAKKTVKKYPSITEQIKNMKAGSPGLMTQKLDKESDPSYECWDREEAPEEKIARLESYIQQRLEEEQQGPIYQINNLENQCNELERSITHLMLEQDNIEKDLKNREKQLRNCRSKLTHLKQTLIEQLS